MSTHAMHVTSSVPDSEWLAAASAVFGALEIISEGDCDAGTERHIAEAAAGASACLARLGVSREQLPELALEGYPTTMRLGAGPAPWASGAEVVPLQRRR